MLEKYNRRASNFVYNMYRPDVSWIYVYDLNSKQQSIKIWFFQDDQI